MYEKPLVTTHNFPGILAISGATTGIQRIPRLPGKRYCRIIDIQSHVTTLIAADQTSALLTIGDGSDADKFVDDQIMGVEADAVGSVRSIRDADARVAAYCSSGKGFIDWETDGIAGSESSPVALADLVVTPVNGADSGTVAGAYNATIIIEWW